MASQIGKANAKGVAVNPVAAVTAAAMSTTMIAPAIHTGIAKTAKATQTIMSVAAVNDPTMTGSASNVTTMTLPTSRMMTTLCAAHLVPRRGTALEVAQTTLATLASLMTL